MIENFIPEGFAPEHRLCLNPQAQDLVFAFSDSKLLVLQEGRLPSWQELQALGLAKNQELYCFGQFQQWQLLLADSLAPLCLSKELSLRPLRSLQGTLDEALFRLAGLGCQLHHWRSRHRFCGHCGTAMQDKEEERALSCPHCSLLSYPQLDPCIMVLVTRGNELLLARSPHFQPGVYSTLAGFIEPGETVENAVTREVHEEVKIRVKKLRYFASQPWPFPNSLMLGFFADYESGEIKMDPKEIEDAQWFTPSTLPQLSSHLSLSRRLIETHLKTLEKP